MNDFFGKNLGWKIFSLILAISLWFVVINIKNPEETMSFTIPVEVENVETITSRYDLIVSNLEEVQNKNIQLNIRGKRLTLETLKNNKRYLNVITATADLELFRFTKADEINKIPIVISFADEYKGIIFEERNQLRYLDVVLEKRKSVTKSIYVDTVGQAEDGYVLLEPKVNPSEITITGAESLINKVDSVKVTVDIADVSQNKKISNLEPKIYDAKGKEILGLQKSVDKVEVTVGVGKKRKVKLQPRIQGTYGEDHITTGIKVEPEEIVVVGNEEIVNNLHQIQLSTIIFEDLVETTVFTPDIILPAGVRRWDSGDQKVSVTIEVKKQVVREFKIPISRLTIQTEMQSKYISKEVTLYLQGIEEEIDKISANMLLGSIDASGYEQGQHKVIVNFNIPKNVKQVGEPPMVEIELIQSEPEENREELDENNDVTEE